MQVVEEVGRVVAEVRWRLGMKGTGQRKSTQVLVLFIKGWCGLDSVLGQKYGMDQVLVWLDFYLVLDFWFSYKKSP